MIKKCANQFLDVLICEYKKEKNQTKIKENIVNPIIQYIIKYIYPYFMTLFVVWQIKFIQGGDRWVIKSQFFRACLRRIIEPVQKVADSILRSPPQGLHSFLREISSIDRDLYTLGFEDHEMIYYNLCLCFQSTSKILKCSKIFKIFQNIFDHNLIIFEISE